MRNLRWPIFIFIPLLVGALVFWEQGDSQGANSDGTAANPLSWFCPVLDQAEPLRLLNPTDSSVDARVTIYSSLFEEDGVTKSTPYISGVFQVTVPANGNELVFVNNLLDDVLVAEQRPQDVSRITSLRGSSAIFISALVEFPTAGPIPDISLCIDKSSSEWFIPFASTGRDACYFLAIFNPFSNVAVLDIEFATDDGLRDPFEGVVVPARSLVVLDVGERIIRRDHFSTSIIARSGKVVAGKYQTFVGKPLDLERKCPESPYDFSTVSGADFSRLWGAEIVVGAPEASSTWYFPSGINPFAGGSYTIYNPDSVSAEVVMTLISGIGPPAIKAFSVPPFQRVVVRVTGGDLHPLPTFPATEERTSSEADGLSHWALFEAEAGIVVESLQTRIGVPYGVQGGLGVISPSSRFPIYKHLLQFGDDFNIAHVGIVNPATDTVAIITVPGVISGVQIPPKRRFLLGIPQDGLADTEFIISTSPIVMAPNS